MKYKNILLCLYNVILYYFTSNFNRKYYFNSNISIMHGTEKKKKNISNCQKTTHYKNLAMRDGNCLHKTWTLNKMPECCKKNLHAEQIGVMGKNKIQSTGFYLKRLWLDKTHLHDLTCYLIIMHNQCIKQTLICNPPSLYCREIINFRPLYSQLDISVEQ